jgi:hypothetical protein
LKQHNIELLGYKKQDEEPVEVEPSIDEEALKAQILEPYLEDIKNAE